MLKTVIPSSTAQAIRAALSGSIRPDALSMISSVRIPSGLIFATPTLPWAISSSMKAWLAAQKDAARVYNADKTYFVLNGTSTSNKVVLNAVLTRATSFSSTGTIISLSITALLSLPAQRLFI